MASTALVLFTNSTAVGISDTVVQNASGDGMWIEGEDTDSYLVSDRLSRGQNCG
jgi:hypothetical protein